MRENNKRAKDILFAFSCKEFILSHSFEVSIKFVELNISVNTLLKLVFAITYSVLIEEYQIKMLLDYLLYLLVQSIFLANLPLEGKSS